MAELRQALQRREAQLDGLLEGQQQWHAIERQLRAESAKLREENTALREESGRLRERVATLEAQLSGVTIVPPKPEGAP